MRTEKFEFPGHSGEMLAARLDAPDQPPRAYALFAHCFTCTKDIYAASRIARALTETGIAVLRFDFTGFGHSDGEFANTNFSSNVEDLVAAADHMRDALAAPHLIIGHSLGGAAVLAAAGKIDEVKAVVTIGAPAEPAHLAHMFQDSAEEIETAGQANVLLAGREFTIKKQFLDDIQEQSLTECLAKLGRALLVMHSPIDNTVGIENAAAIFAAAKHPKSFISLDDADHLVSRKDDAEYAATVLAAWASRYIPALVVSDRGSLTENVWDG
ncbi:MAG: alpha/beta fold hydrolase [Rhodospirillaceae bacterium]|jgi:pimeloyl-ACP methyl ester carboxylesterase|nr:alpha/beta fold hydrolase [Rhodospirillaceae bacterium]